MSSVPIITSEADISAAVRIAGRNRGSRAYVAKRMFELGHSDAIPPEWGLTTTLVAAGWDAGLHPRGRDGKYIEKFGIVRVFGGKGFFRPSFVGEAIGAKHNDTGDYITVKATSPGKNPDGKAVNIGDEVSVRSSNIASSPPAKARMLPSGLYQGHSGGDQPAETKAEAGREKFVRSDAVREKASGSEFKIAKANEDGSVTTNDGNVLKSGEFDTARRQAREGEAEAGIPVGEVPEHESAAEGREALSTGAAKYAHGDIIRDDEGDSFEVDGWDPESKVISAHRVNGTESVAGFDPSDVTMSRRGKREGEKTEGPSKLPSTKEERTITSPKANIPGPDQNKLNEVSSVELDRQLRDSLSALGIDPDSSGEPTLDGDPEKSALDASDEAAVKQAIEAPPENDFVITDDETDFSGLSDDELKSQLTDAAVAGDTERLTTIAAEISARKSGATRVSDSEFVITDDETGLPAVPEGDDFSDVEVGLEDVALSGLREQYQTDDLTSDWTEGDPDPATSDEFARAVLSEAYGFQKINLDHDSGPDLDLNDYMLQVKQALQSGDGTKTVSAAEELRAYLVMGGYSEDSELPNSPEESGGSIDEVADMVDAFGEGSDDPASYTPAEFAAWINIAEGAGRHDLIQALNGFAPDKVLTVWKGIRAERDSRSPAALSPEAHIAPAILATSESPHSKAIRLSLQNSATNKGLGTDVGGRLDAAFAKDPAEAHKDIAKLMTELKLGGKQRARLRGLVDEHFGGDSSGPLAEATAENLSPDNPLKSALAAKASSAVLDGTPQRVIEDLDKQALNLTADDISRLEDYVLNGAFDGINAGLRGTNMTGGDFSTGDLDMGWVNQAAQAMDEALAKTKSSGEITLYRGVGSDVTSGWKAGSVLEDKGFMSTSLSPDVAEGFGDAVIKITYPGGRSALHVDGIKQLSDSLGQNEIILPRGLRLQVKSIQEVGGKTMVTADALDAGLPSAGGTESPASIVAPDFPTPAPGAKVYEHPMGAKIYANPDGSMEAYGKDGRKKKTSATPEKLAAGHGTWVEETGAASPAATPEVGIIQGLTGEIRVGQLPSAKPTEDLKPAAATKPIPPGNPEAASDAIQDVRFGVGGGNGSTPKVGHEWDDWKLADAVRYLDYATDETGNERQKSIDTAIDSMTEVLNFGSLSDEQRIEIERVLDAMRGKA